MCTALCCNVPSKDATPDAEEGGVHSSKITTVAIKGTKGDQPRAVGKDELYQNSTGGSQVRHFFGKSHTLRSGETYRANDSP